MKRDVILIENISIFISISIIIFLIINYFFNRYSSWFLNKNNENQSVETNLVVYSLLSILWIYSISLVLNKYFNTNFIFLKNSYDFVFILLFLLIYLNKNAISYLFFKVISSNSRYDLVLKNKFFLSFWKFFASLGLLFINFLLPFEISQNYLFLITLIIFIFFELFEALYLILKLSTNSFNWYYKILYLCTLEILPLLTFLKMLFGNKYL